MLTVFFVPLIGEKSNQLLDDLKLFAGLKPLLKA